MFTRNSSGNSHSKYWDDIGIMELNLRIRCQKKVNKYSRLFAWRDDVPWVLTILVTVSEIKT
ncbi:MAG: hypothetical protein EBR09_11240 [Proteobacteria bacterium]|nr:hypothetical protein [Pseudomonadota bacterium]